MDKLKKLLRNGNPLVALFIVEAVLTKAQNVIDDGLKDWPEHHIISREAWINIAEQCQDALK